MMESVDSEHVKQSTGIPFECLTAETLYSMTLPVRSGHRPCSSGTVGLNAEPCSLGTGGSGKESCP